MWKSSSLTVHTDSFINRKRFTLKTCNDNIQDGHLKYASSEFNVPLKISFSQSSCLPAVDGRSTLKRIIILIEFFLCALISWQRICVFGWLAKRGVIVLVHSRALLEFEFCVCYHSYLGAQIHLCFKPVLEIVLIVLVILITDVFLRVLIKENISDSCHKQLEYTKLR